MIIFIFSTYYFLDFIFKPYHLIYLSYLFQNKTKKKFRSAPSIRSPLISVILPPPPHQVIKEFLI